MRTKVNGGDNPKQISIHQHRHHPWQRTSVRSILKYSRQKNEPIHIGCYLINEDKDGGILCGFNDILKSLILRIRRFEPGRNRRHRLQESVPASCRAAPVMIKPQRVPEPDFGNGGGGHGLMKAGSPIAIKEYQSPICALVVQIRRKADTPNDLADGPNELEDAPNGLTGRPNRRGELRFFQMALSLNTRMF